MDLWPNTDMNTVSAMGAYNFTGHSRASAYLSFSNMTNNDALDAVSRSTAPFSRRR
jgi:hypothetical protein